MGDGVFAPFPYTGGKTRIAICGLAGDLGDVPDGWREYRWRNAGGIGGGSSNGKPNEVVLFSPHCLGRRAPQATQCQLGL